MRLLEPVPPAAHGQQSKVPYPSVQVPEPPSEHDPFPETEPAVMPYAPAELDLLL